MQVTDNVSISHMQNKNVIFSIFKNKDIHNDADLLKLTLISYNVYILCNSIYYLIY